MLDHKDQSTNEDTHAQGGSENGSSAWDENKEGDNKDTSNVGESGSKENKDSGEAPAASDSASKENVDTGGSAVEKAKETASTLLDQAKTTAGGAYDVVAGKASSVIEEQKLELMVGLAGVADTVRRVSGALSDSDPQLGATEFAAKYTETAAKKLENAAQYFETTDLKSMARDVESYARRNPAIFLGGAFALGILAARFFKSTPTASAADSQNGETSEDTPKKGRGRKNGKSVSASV